MRCPSCGSEGADDARFCASCGRALGGSDDERRVVTVLFADIVGFTTLSERLDPERVKILVDRCFEVVAAEIHAFGGRVDKIVGDAVIALFGAPVAHSDDAERAVRAGLRLHDVIREEAEALGFDLRLRIGINTGEVLVGAMRAAGSVTAMGDVVNTAARLQTAAEPGSVLVGSSTHEATVDAIAYRPLGRRSLRGRVDEVEVWEAVAPIAAPGERRRRRDLPLFGRDDELALLKRAVAASFSNGRTLVVLLSGAVGVGKSRLADEVARWAVAEHGAVAREGRCLPYGEANVLWPVAEVMRAGLDLSPDDDEAAIRAKLDRHLGRVLGEETGPEEMARVSDGLALILGLEPDSSPDPSTVREEATRSMIVYTRALADIVPLVLQISDLHVGDDALLRLIDEVVSNVPARPVVVLVTAHSVILERWQPRAGRHNQLVLHLDPLERSATAELLRALAGDDVPEELTEALLSRSGGNPFFLEELVSLVDVTTTDTGTVQVVPADGAPPVAEQLRAGDGDRSLPATLRGLVAARLDDLDPAARAVLQDAAVIGSRGNVDVLVHLVADTRPADAIDTAAVILRLDDDDLIQVEGDAWSFRSIVVRDVAYQNLTKTDRARAHLSVGSYLEDEFERRQPRPTWLVDQLASHHAAAARLMGELGDLASTAGLPADLPTRARHWVGIAAARSEREGAIPVAARRYRSALEFAEMEGLEGAELAALQLRLANAAVEAWELDEALEAAAAARASDPDDRSVAAATAEVRGVVAQRRGDIDAARDELTRAAEAFAELGDVGRSASALRLRALAEIFGGLLDDGRRSAAAALEGFESTEDLDGQGWALHHLAWIAFVGADIELADEHLRRAIDAFSDVGDSRGLAWARGLSGWVRFRKGEIAEAEALGEEVLAEAQARSDRWAVAMMTTLLAGVSLWSGRIEDAVTRARDAARDFRDLGNLYGAELASLILTRAEELAGQDVGTGEVAAVSTSSEAGVDERRRLELLDEGWRELLAGSPVFGS